MMSSGYMTAGADVGNVISVRADRDYNRQAGAW